MNEISISNILNRLKAYAPETDLALVEKAYQFADRVHAGQKRKSGDPYIEHPLTVARILTDLEQDAITIAAGLLHDVVEDREVAAETLRAEFGGEVARLVEGVTKLSRLTYDSAEKMQAENFRKMFLAMAEDIRVIVIKLADRLHNMQTLEYLSPSRQKAIALETREIFAPLAHRLGMWHLKWLLEDLSFHFLEPAQYHLISQRVAQSRQERENYVAGFIAEITARLAEAGVEAAIKGRPKHFFSIYKKMTDQNLQFNELYDLLGIRIIVGNIKECYQALGLIHEHWKPIPGHFKDYIAMPKPNMYQSLHTAVVGPGGYPVEVQIRTEQMNRVAEYGVAAHWLYKDRLGRPLQSGDKLTWLKQLLEWQKDLADAKEFMDSVKIDFFSDQVFVFTPKGDVVDLPLGATPLDLAYRIHTEVGHRYQGAKVNGRIVSLGYQLKSGDIIEIITAKQDKPSLDWLNFAQTHQARSKIKQWFHHRRRDENVDQGRAELVKELRRYLLDASAVLTETNLKKILEAFKIEQADDLYAAIGQGEISPGQVARKLKEMVEVASRSEELELPKVSRPRPRSSGGVVVEGMEGVLIRLSRCCSPLPGDAIVGFITRGRGVSIHRRDCKNLRTAQKHLDRIITEVRWQDLPTAHYPVEVAVRGFDRIGLLKDVTSKIAECGTSINSVQLRTDKDAGVVTANLVIEVANIEQLQQVTQAVRDINGVYDVYRLTPASRDEQDQA